MRRMGVSWPIDDQIRTTRHLVMWSTIKIKKRGVYA
nr:MAG TPA: hypothetical protein [Caudoviricetes sp.]